MSENVHPPEATTSAAEQAAGSPGRLSARAPAKINLGLFVGAQRSDGRHRLVSVMQSISLADTLSVKVNAVAEQSDRLHCDAVEIAPDENLVLRALNAYRLRFGWDGPALEVRLEKRVPIAAGLGGGSGDAAAMLRLLEALNGEQPAAERSTALMHLAAELGADVPAQLRPGRWLAAGAGELLVALPAPAAICGVLVLALNARLSTADVYSRFDAIGARRSAEELSDLEAGISAALSDGSVLPVAELLENDLQPAARSLCPQIDPALELAMSAGAERVLLSGSGPTVLGLFTGTDALARAQAAAQQLGAALGRFTAAQPADSRLHAIRWVCSASFVGENFAAVRARA